MVKNRLVFILGPTSSGKSAVAADLAKRVGGEIISCDSMQVYRDMDILTQAPGEDIISGIPHHLVRIIPPEEEFSAARFVDMAMGAVADILSRGRVPVFAGGTGLYVKSLLDGLFDSPPKNEELRRRLGKIAVERGTEHLYAKLRKIDPEAAERIHRNDLRRIVRALEVYEITGRAISEKRAESRGIYNDHDCMIFGLRLPRGLLYERIEGRVDGMFDKGLVDEVRALRERDISITAEKALGLKEVSAFLEGRASLEEVRGELKKNTRRYAKRQLTWFRRDGRVEWIDADRGVREIVDDIEGHL